MIKKLIRYFRDPPREFVVNIARDIDNNLWRTSGTDFFGPFCVSEDEKLYLHRTFDTFSLYRYMELYYSNPGHRNQIIKLNYKEQGLLWDAAHNALDRYNKGLRKQADDYIENLLQESEETRI